MPLPLGALDPLAVILRGPWSLIADPAPGDEIDGETAEPMATFVVFTGHSGQARRPMRRPRRLRAPPGADRWPANLR